MTMTITTTITRLHRLVRFVHNSTNNNTDVSTKSIPTITAYKPNNNYNNNNTNSNTVNNNKSNNSNNNDNNNSSNAYSEYWTPDRRRSLKMFNYSWPLVVMSGYILYNRYNDDEKYQQYITRIEQQRNSKHNITTVNVE